MVALGFGSDDTFFTPPRRIKLLTEHGTKGFEQNGFCCVHSRIQSNHGGRGGPSYWNVRSPNEIDLTWTDGFTGIRLKLTRTGNELRGWVHHILMRLCLFTIPFMSRHAS